MSFELRLDRYFFSTALWGILPALPVRPRVGLLAIDGVFDAIGLVAGTGSKDSTCHSIQTWLALSSEFSVHLNCGSYSRQGFCESLWR